MKVVRGEFLVRGQQLEDYINCRNGGKKVTGNSQYCYEMGFDQKWRKIGLRGFWSVCQSVQNFSYFSINCQSIALQILLLLFGLFININMPERKIWTPQEDKVLKYLKEQIKIPKWSIIAKKMEQQHNMPGRTGKQCRERYHNHLDSKIVHNEWNRQQEQFLYNLHNQIGNKWAIIAQQMPGRSDNCVKNHFYSKMRKALRKLNKVIFDNFKKQFREIKMSVLYKIVEAADQKFQNSSNVEPQIYEQCFRMKNLLLEYSYDEDNSLDGDETRLKELASDIHKFNSQYHKKKKKVRRASFNDKQGLTLPKFEKSIALSEEQNEDSDYSMAFSMSEAEDDKKADEKQQKVYSPPLGRVEQLPEELKSSYEVAWKFYNFNEMKDSSSNQIQVQNNSNMVSYSQKNLPMKLDMSADHDQIRNMLFQEGALKYEGQNKNLLSNMPNMMDKSSQGGSQMDEDFGMEEENIGMKMLGQSIQHLKIKDFEEDSALQEKDKLFIST